MVKDGSMEEKKWVFEKDSIAPAPEWKRILVAETIPALCIDSSNNIVEAGNIWAKGQEYVTVNEAAKILRLSPRTIYRLLRTNKLDGKKYGRQWRIRRDSLGKDVPLGG